MKIPPLTITEPKTQWDYSDSFGNNHYEYIKSFTHRDYSIGYHIHKFYELNIVINGEGYHYIEQMSCPANPGCVFLIPPNVKHGYMSLKNLDVYHMLIHKDFLKDCFGEFERTDGFSLLFEIEPRLRANYDESVFLSLSDSELGILKQDIGIIETLTDVKNSDIFVNAIAKKILCYLCFLMAHKHAVLEKNQEGDNELVNIIDSLNYIHKNFNEKLTICSLAEKCHMSRSTFIRHFTKMTGVSPHKYIREYRIKKALQYIRTTDKSLAFIAQECGFYDVAHMQKVIGVKKGGSVN